MRAVRPLVIRVALVVAAAVAVVPTAAAARPLLITPAGVAGVRQGVTLAQVKQRLGVKFIGEGVSDDFFGAVCGDKLSGEAGFHVRSGVAHLTYITFTGGVRTREGISPGSTFRQLRRAYGRRLILDKDTDIHEADADVVRGSPHNLVFMVEDGHVDSIGLATHGVLAVRCPTVLTPPPPTIGVLSLTGASGLEPVLPQDEVAAVWPWFPILTEASGSGSDSYMPICAGAVRGSLEFGGGALARLWLYAGASTDTGITIGSTIDDLRQTYGTTLIADPDGFYYVHAPGPPPIATLGFHVDDGVVTEIGFGGAQAIGGAYAPKSYSKSC
jgi:hypothetical protein